MQLHRSDPGPSFFPFVLTSLDGTRLYGSCLTFYEPISETLLLDLWKKLGKGIISFVYFTFIYFIYIFYFVARFFLLLISFWQMLRL